MAFLANVWICLYKVYITANFGDWHYIPRSKKTEASVDLLSLGRPRLLP